VVGGKVRGPNRRIAQNAEERVLNDPQGELIRGGKKSRVGRGHYSVFCLLCIGCGS